VNISDHFRRLLVGRHQAQRAQDAKIEAALEEREILQQQRRRVRERQLAKLILLHLWLLMLIVPLGLLILYIMMSELTGR
jgi:cell division septal protein FtsQ